MTVIYIDDTAVPLIEGAGGGCFSADTQISTEFGTTSISEIEVGDVVWSYDDLGTIVLSKVTETFYHPRDTLYRVTHEYGYLDITSNHWVLKEDGTYQELKDFNVGDNLLTANNTLSKIISIEFLRDDEVYNFKVSHLHAYIANGIKVHNGGGGGKGGASGGVEDPNTLFSTDILFVTMGLGEGPVYRINPNGPQDIEVNEGNIDDLINYETSLVAGDNNQLGGGVKTDRLFILSNTGSITQQTLPFFGDAVYTPQRLQSGLDLKKGNVAGIPRSALELQSTSVAAITALKFYFICQGMQKQDSSGNIVGSETTVKVTIYDSTGSRAISAIERKYKGKTNVGYSFDIYVSIPSNEYSNLGYKFTVEKTSDDSDTAKKQDAVTIQGWTEITERPIAYTRTATIGYAIKAYSEHKGSLPAITNMVKGLLVKVPSNYNQPILENGDIDWRQIEVSDNYRSSTTNNIDGIAGQVSTNLGGYYQQKTANIIQTGTNPVIYDGVWDGQFVYSWTQNPAWIIYDMLTNNSYGLGIPEKNLDKYSFYEAAVYCDACDVITGRFIGVSALADGTYRYKPRGNYKRKLTQSLVGLLPGTPIKERRFILDTVIADQKQVIDIINALTLTFRAILFYTGGKIALYQDRPDDMPVAVFNETNIIAGTINISGIGEESLLTGVDITYNEAVNHYRRETLRVDDSKALKERNYIENIAKIDLTGITRKSQALRLAQYVIAESKYSRRKIGFKTGMEGSDLYPGAVISVSQKSNSVNWGYGGLVANTSPSNLADIYLEYIGTPAIDSSFFTSNTGPLFLRIASSNSGLIDSYIISNNPSDYSFIRSGNTYYGADIIKVKVLSKYNHPSKTFNAFSGTWGISHNPSRKDVWTLGEINNPSNIYSSLSDKLFRIINIKRDKDETVFIEGKEYINNVYIDSDTTINYNPLFYGDFFSPLQPPPPPNFNLTAITKRDNDGSIYTDLEISSFTDTRDYSKEIKTEFYHATPESYYSLVSNTSTNGGGNIITLKLSSVDNITNGTSATLLGKNGFTTEAGTVRLLVINKAKVDTNPGIDDNGNIALTVPGLSGLIDKNFEPDTHILDVINNFSLSLKGKNRLTLQVYNGADYADVAPGFVNYNSPYKNITAEIIGYNAASATIKIKNVVTNGKSLLDSLPGEAFYVSVKQVLDTQYFANTMYITGSSYEIVRTNTITSANSSDHFFTQPLGVSAKHKDFITVTINGTAISSGDYTLSTGADGLANSKIEINLATVPTVYNDLYLEVRTKVYTVPLLERGDNVITSSGKTAGIVATTYELGSPTYNAWLTANNIYNVSLTSPIEDISSGEYLTSITTDPSGVINNLNIGAKTVTFDYSSREYPGLFNNGNNIIYTLTTPALTYKPLSYSDAVARTLNRVSYGTHFVRARTANKYGRRSPFVTKSVTVKPLGIPAVNDLAITEELYIDSTIGVATRVLISFTPLAESFEATDYEVSYRIDSTVESLNTKYQSLKVASTSTDTDGKIRIRVDNIDVGSKNTIKNIMVARVTPLNKTIRGSTIVVNKNLVGKDTPPQNIINFVVGQSIDQLTLQWDYVKDPNTRKNVDIDLSTIVVKRIAGIYNLTTTDLSYLWTVAQTLEEFSAIDTSKNIPIDQFGPFTYLAKTVDTSGNQSSTVIGYVYTSVQKSSLTTYIAFSEDNPSVPWVTGVTNNNSTEFNFASFANSNNYGFYKAYNAGIPGSFNASKVDNANGTSTGWSVVGGSPTNIKATTTAIYQTQVRDVGAIITGTVYTDIYGYQGVKSTWLDQLTVIKEGVTEATTSGSLKDINFSGSLGIGNILGYANASAATVSYNPEVRTLVSGASLSTANNNLYAITTGSGNYVGDVSNANIICFIAAVTSADTVLLGNSYYANGMVIPGIGYSNLAVAGSKYKLVNLNQWIDLNAGATFQGEAGNITEYTEIRYATDYPFTLNNSANNNLFSTSSGVDGFTKLVTDTRTFRYFQLRHTVTNLAPDQYDYTLDRFNYKVSLNDKVFQSSVIVSSLKTFVNYESAGFTRIPKISGLIVTESSNAIAYPTAVIVDKGLTGANVAVYFGSNGASAHNIGTAPVVDISVVGV